MLHLLIIHISISITTFNPNLPFKQTNGIKKKVNEECPALGTQITQSCTSTNVRYYGESQSIYHISSKPYLNAIFARCSFDKFKITSSASSIIKVSGSNAINLNITQCYFTNNQLSSTDTSLIQMNNPTIIRIQDSTFFNNSCKNAPIIGGSSFRFECYRSDFSNNTANYKSAQIELSYWDPSTNSPGTQFQMSNVSFNNNSASTTYSIVHNLLYLTYFTQISFQYCNFQSQNQKVQEMIGIYASSLTVIFLSCCFLNSFSGLYPTNYHHVQIDTSQRSYLRFAGTNLFSLDQSYISNYQIFSNENPKYGVNQCPVRFTLPTIPPTPTQEIIESSSEEIIELSSLEFIESSSEFIESSSSEFIESLEIKDSLDEPTESSSSKSVYSNPETLYSQTIPSKSTSMTTQISTANLSESSNLSDKAAINDSKTNNGNSNGVIIAIIVGCVLVAASIVISVVVCFCARKNAYPIVPFNNESEDESELSIDTMAGIDEGSISSDFN